MNLKFGLNKRVQNQVLFLAFWMRVYRQVLGNIQKVLIGY